MTGDGALKTVGVFCDGRAWADLWFNQCDGADGRHRGIWLRPYDFSADHLVLMGNMSPEAGGYSVSSFARRKAKAQGRLDALVLERICDRIGRDRGDLSMVVYEPRDAYSDAWFEVANERFGRVYGPDDRASDVIVLPTMWTDLEGVSALGMETAGDDRPVLLACVTSGKTVWAGHRDRLSFLRLLRAEGVEMSLYGNGLPDGVGGLGPVQSKGAVLRGARFTLAIENDAGNDHYVTEKIWDPLLAWSLPIYYGSRAVDSIIPPEAYIRLPDLGAGGLETIREVLANPSLWEERLGAIGEARRRILGEHRFVEFLAKNLLADGPDGGSS